MFYGPEIVLKTIKAALGVLAGWRAARDWECLHPINGVTDPFPEGLPAPNPTVTSPYPRTCVIHTDMAAALEVFSSSGKISVSLIQTERRRSQQLPVSWCQFPVLLWEPHQTQADIPTSMAVIRAGAAETPQTFGTFITAGLLEPDYCQDK